MRLAGAADCRRSGNRGARLTAGNFQAAIFDMDGVATYGRGARLLVKGLIRPADAA